MIRVWPAYKNNFEETKEFQRQAKELISKGYIRENMSLCDSCVTYICQLFLPMATTRDLSV
jgi:hypothetical protein